MSLLQLEILETIGVVALVLLSVGAGFALLRSKRFQRFWWLGYAMPLGIILCIDIPRWFDGATIQSLFGVFVKGRVEFALMGFAIPLLFIVCVHKLRTRGQRVTVGVFGGVATMNFAILPFLLPVITYAELAGIDSKFDSHGVCLQSTNCNCGPAAAVTALGQVGVDAEESVLAMHARTTKISGTQVDLLGAAMFDLYGVQCHVEHLEEYEKLGKQVPSIALVKLTLFVDHYIAILEVHDDHLIVGDPLSGRERLGKEEFMERWRKTCIVFDSVANR